MMPIPLFPEAFEDLVNEDIEWLKANTEHSLEREHIIDVLQGSVYRYKNGGYMKAMMSNDS